MLAPVGQFASSYEPREAMLAAIADSGVDHVCVGDHVSFHVGAGADGLIDAASMLTRYADLPCYVALYLLPLRHPVPVARQLAGSVSSRLAG
jgi:alkanesulfonate monooxygenase SsuD/methylene tetrahydromethanopterin reductase-like flavin-dependent oxidoreductase (luciferase family)